MDKKAIKKKRAAMPPLALFLLLADKGMKLTSNARNPASFAGGRSLERG